MGTRGDEDDEDWFFDAREEVSSISDCSSDDSSCLIGQETGGFDLWTQNPESVLCRRRRFLESMGFSFKTTSADDYGDTVLSDQSSVSPLSNSASDDYVDRVKNMELLRNESKSSGSYGDRSSLSSLSNSLGEALRDNMAGEDLFARNVYSNSSCMDEGFSEPGSSKSSNCSFGDFDNSLLNHRESYTESRRKGAKGWLKKLSALRHVLDRHNDSSERESVGSPLRRIARVQSYKKQFKELSTLYVGQEFSAHDGPILTMKFSPDGKFLGTAGEDCVVRVWEITEEERADGFEVTESDSTSSYAYFRMDDSLSQIEPLDAESEKKRRFLKMSSDLTCVILPPKVFAISETPLHEFRGHTDEILDLSWSQKGLLLSSSMDETVRLWRVGSHECLKVFSHKNFVTCVAFNPVDEDYFISGSIDGKVRMWDVSHCRVVDYTDVRDIITAVCYRPDAKGAVIGTMTGDCRFYQILDDRLQLDREINLHGKKKVPSKRITGFQYFPGDTNKLMVTCADSQIRILSGDDLICKLKGDKQWTTLSSASASFTWDGKHIVSTAEDSGVSVWSYDSQPNKKPSSSSSKKPSSSSSKKPRSIRSCERFVSHNTSVAVPWQPVHGHGMGGFISDLDVLLPQYPSSGTTTTTWPEEKLPRIGRSKMKVLKRSGWAHHLWGLVIVAATLDGKIRAFHNYGLPVRL